MSFGMEATAGEPKARPGAWWMLALLFFFYMMSILDRIIITMLVDPISKDLGLSDFKMSLLLGPAFVLCYSVFGFPLGWAVDRFPRRIVVFVCVVFWSLATAASGLATTFAALFLARMAVGVGEAGLNPAAYSLIPDAFPRKRRTTAFAIYQTGNKIGQGAALALGGLIVGLASQAGFDHVPVLSGMQPWHRVFVLIGAPSLLFAALALTFVEPPRRDTAQSTDAAAQMKLVTYLKANKLLVGSLIAGFASISIVSSAISLWVPTFMARSYGWTPVQYGPLLGVVSLVAAGLLVLNGVIVDRFYARGMKDAHIRFYSWQLLAFLPIGAILFLVPSPLAFIALYGVAQAVALPYLMYMSATVQLLVVNELRGRMTAVFMFVVTILSLGAGPTIVAALTDFVFRDPAMLKWSLACVTTVFTLLALLALRLSLRPLGPAIERSHHT